MKGDVKVAAWLLALSLFAQFTMLGGDGAFLGMICAVLNCTTGLLLITIARPQTRFYTHLLLPFFLFGAGLVWSLWPDIGGRAVSERIAPDLVPTELARMLGYGVLLAGTASLGYRRGPTRYSSELICLAGALNLLIGLLLSQLDKTHIWGLAKGIQAARFSGTMLNANAMGTVFGVVALLALGAALVHLREGKGSKPFHELWLCVFLVIFTGTLGGVGLTGSRTAFVVCLLGSATLLLYHWLATRKQAGNGITSMIWLGVLLLNLLVAGGYAAMQRMQGLAGDAVSRTELWRHFGTLAERAGPHGFGLGSFSEINTALLPVHDLATDLWYINSAHNIVLQMIIEGGLLFPALMFAGLIPIMIAIWRGRPDSLTGRIVLLACVLGLGVIIAGGMVDVALNIPAVVSLAAALVGLLWGRSVRYR
ncbi:MAG: O-antigen ligase family protein [Sphingobium sp.]